MAVIKFFCPKCNQKLDAPNDAAGQQVECPKCRQIIEIPATSDPAALAPLPGKRPHEDWREDVMPIGGPASKATEPASGGDQPTPPAARKDEPAAAARRTPEATLHVVPQQPQAPREISAAAAGKPAPAPDGAAEAKAPAPAEGREAVPSRPIRPPASTLRIDKRTLRQELRPEAAAAAKPSVGPAAAAEATAPAPAGPERAPDSKPPPAAPTSGTAAPPVAPPQRWPAGVLMAAILCALWALITACISLRLLLVDAAANLPWDKVEVLVPLAATWNLMVAGAYVFFAMKILSRDRWWGWGWALGGSALNAAASVVQMIRCIGKQSDGSLSLGPAVLGSLTLPLELAIVALLLLSARHFTRT